MLIEISKITTGDRIRKDFGDIQELADDIKENGLINPPVVTPELELIAGERRLKALQLLDYKQIEVRVMSVKDAEHQLNLEISENETRKDFSKKERIDYARRLERIEKVKANERQSELNGKSLLTENFPQAETGNTRDIVAQKLGIGSGKQYEKEKYIVDNANEEILNAWDKGNISTNKAYITLMEEKKALEKENQQLKNQPPTVIEKVPSDYYSDKRKVEEKQSQINDLIKEKELLIRKAELNDKNAKRYEELTSQIKTLSQQKDNMSRQMHSATELSGLVVEVKHYFDGKFAPIKYSRAIQEASEDEIVKRNLKDILDTFQNWIDEMNNYIKKDNEIEIIDVEVIE